MKKMKDLQFRILGALLYGAAMLLGLSWNIWSFQIIMLILFVLSIREFRNLERLGTGVYYNYGVYFLAAFSVSGFLFFSTASLSFSFLVEIAIVLGIAHHLFVFFTLWVGKEEWYFSWPSWFRAALYLGLSFGAIFTYSLALLDYHSKWVLLFLLAIWASDIGAYFLGSQLGRRALHTRLSPKKTVEGLIGGIASCFLFLFVFSSFSEISLTRIVTIGFLVPLTGTMGDLVVSAYKRRAGVKDSGKVIPGHGGILDRIDAYIYCQPFVAYLLL
jgi:phosphatidate cytidylyltransferase